MTAPKNLLDTLPKSLAKVNAMETEENIDENIKPKQEEDKSEETNNKEKKALGDRQ